MASFEIVPTETGSFAFFKVESELSFSNYEKGFVSSSFLSSLSVENKDANSTPTPAPSPAATVSISSTSFPDCVERHSNSNCVTDSWWLWFGVAMFGLGMWAHCKLSRSSAVNINVDRRH